MIINLVIIILLIWAFMIGYSRGLILQVIYSLAALVAAVIAGIGYQGLAKTLTSWVPFASATQDSKLLFFGNPQLLFRADDAFYAGLAFLIIFLVVFTIARLLGLLLHIVAMPFGRKGKIIAGILGLATTYFGLQMAFTLLALVPMGNVQEQLYASGLVRFMVLHTPISSSILQNTFIQNITHLNPLG
ncbi:CvpA family protein [Lactococcus termiticola]|uniref:Colicin V production protein n=1 Tax=Lactococcus termiticola TaxID=2169526 RepID=A0A2R5HJA7_9LACT|nr:CvpA family protein [Lactococcus termiticola]GBG96618.1 colicin V production protein [Lactococcus termiticola]